jgi:hypothetical protein
MILDPDRVRTVDLSSWYRVSQPVQGLDRPLPADVPGQVGVACLVSSADCEDLYYEKIRSMTYLIRLIMTRRVADIDGPAITEREF